MENKIETWLIIKEHDSPRDGLQTEYVLVCFSLKDARQICDELVKGSRKYDYYYRKIKNYVRETI